jgi:hypothetical protein
MSYDGLESLGRERLSKNFFMREFLYSEIAHWNGLRNIPDHPEVALRVGRQLCIQLLEPLQETFGRIHVRSGYRSPEVNAFGNLNGLNCATNEKNYAGHIWDYPDANGHFGATACIVVPALVDFMDRGGSWTSLAWWIHDHLPYSSLCFFSKLGAFNIGWHEQLARRIDSYAKPLGCLTRPGKANHGGTHKEEYTELLGSMDIVLPTASAYASPATALSVTLQNVEAPPVRSASPNTPTGNASAACDAIQYRAVHTKTNWRKAGGHGSIESAIFGRNGAAGLFAGKVRTDYARHGEPLYVLVWQSSHSTGKLIRRSSVAASGIDMVDIPVVDLERFDAHGAADVTQLARYFG